MTDKLDMKILAELDRNSRQSIKSIAKKCNVSRDVINYRISVLEKKGIVNGYYTLIDYSKLGYILTRVYLKFKNTTPALEKEMVSYLLKKPNTLTVYETEGDWNLVACILIGGLEEFDKTWSLFKKRFRKYILEQEITIIYKLIGYFKNYLTKETDLKEIITGSSRKEKIDKVDLKLLNIISTNARISIIDLSKKLKLSPTASVYRLKQLEKKKVILAYRSQIDIRKLGYEYYKVNLELDNLKIIKVLKDFMKRHPNVIFEDMTIGDFDFEFDMEIRGYDEFYSFMRKLKELFPKAIRTYRFYRAVKIYKFVYVPRV